MQSPVLVPPISDLEAALASRNREQVRRRQRFAFGRNWQRFLGCLDETRIRSAEMSLQRMLGIRDLRGRTFLDVGSGSGLFSLAAMRLGATWVHSFDFDPESMECARELRRRYFPQAESWTIECGDILSDGYLMSLRRADVVYSWGVLHQTGQMWQAIENTLGLVAPRGQLYMSIYNHQPLLTPFWVRVKRLYNRLPKGTRWPIVLGYLAVKMPLLVARDILVGRDPRSSFSSEHRRGMSVVYDAIDWIGGYPHETATPEAVFRFVRDRGFALLDLRTVGGGSGCNEFVFQRVEACGSCI